MFNSRFLENSTYWDCHISYKLLYDDILCSRISRIKRTNDHLSNAQCN